MAGSSPEATAAAKPSDVLVTAIVSPSERGLPIPQSFLGVSTDWNRVIIRTGVPATGPNTVYDRLIANLARYGGGVPTLRVGGNFQDSAWWDPSGQVNLRDDQRGMYTPITARTLQGLAINARATRQRMILGLNLGADDPRLVQAEVRAFLKYVPRHDLLALAIGNEPGQYPYHPRFQRTVQGRHVVRYLRGHSWNANQYIGEWRRMAAAIRRVHPGLPLAGTDNFPGLVSAQHFIARTGRQLTVYTQHYYAESACTQTGHQYKPGSPHYPTISGLLGTQPFAITPDIQGAETARSHHKPFYVDEMNSTSCGGRNGFSNSLGAALWLLDQYFVNVLIGVDGVDLHVDDPVEAPFGFGYDLQHHRWYGAVTPLYYSMLAFARAVGSHGRFLRYPLFSARSPVHANVHVFGVRDADGSLRLVVINKDLRRGGRVRLLLPHGRGTAQLARLLGPSPKSTSGVTLGGQAVAPDGSLRGRRRSARVDPSGGVYQFWVAPASAAILTIPGKRR
jgi:hypothetical protein